MNNGPAIMTGDSMEQSLAVVEQKEVEFYGDAIIAVRVAGGGVFVPIRPICDNLGITLAGQRERINRDIEITGVLLTMYDERKNICRDVAEKVKDHFGEKVFRTRIRENVRLAEAPSFGKAIGEFSPNCHGAEDYRSLAREILRRGKQ